MRITRWGGSSEGIGLIEIGLALRGGVGVFGDQGG